MKVCIYNKSKKLMGVKYLKLENLEQNQEKRFMVHFKDENIESYSIDIVEDSEETQKAIENANNIFGKKFTKEELTIFTIVVLVIYSMI